MFKKNNVAATVTEMKSETGSAKKNGKYFICKEIRQDINQRNQQDNLSQACNKQ